MADVKPFRALRPLPSLAKEVISPPYDVLSDLECRQLAQSKHHFIHVTRAEVDLPTSVDPHSDHTYAKARENLDAFKHDGILQLDPNPTYYFYGQTMGSHRQIGILAAVSVDEYERGVIAKHEWTRPDKEDDRTRHMDILDAQVGLVFLTHHPHDELERLTQTHTQQAPEWCAETEDGVIHEFWPAPLSAVTAIQTAFKSINKTYIADGHHRSAAAARIHRQRQTPQSAYFLAGLFPANALVVMAYNRIVEDLNGHSPEEFLNKISTHFSITENTGDTPSQHHDIRMYLSGVWYQLTPRANIIDSSDPVASLDAALLQDALLQPILGIENPRKSTRIRFIGGIHGPKTLEDTVNQSGGVAFHLYPTSMDQLFKVADAGKVMPPKSTWFEPKLREGVVVRLLD